MIYTSHALNRKAERNVKESSIKKAMKQGTLIYRQGMKFYVHPNDRLIVVTSNYETEAEVIITLYFRNNAMKYIKKKDKRRYKNAS